MILVRVIGDCEMDLPYIEGTVDVGLVFEKDVGGKQECTGCGLLLCWGS